MLSQNALVITARVVPRFSPVGYITTTVPPADRATHAGNPLQLPSLADATTLHCLFSCRSTDPRRRSTAAAILSNIHYHPGNATTLYKTEIKLKFAALLRLRGEGVRLSV